MAKIQNSKNYTVPKIVFHNIAGSNGMVRGYCRSAILEQLDLWEQQHCTEYTIVSNTRTSLHIQLPTIEWNTHFALTWNPRGVCYLEYRIVEWL